MSDILFEPDELIAEAERLVSQYPISEEDLIALMRLGAALSNVGISVKDLARMFPIVTIE